MTIDLLIIFGGIGLMMMLGGPMFAGMLPEMQNNPELETRCIYIGLIGMVILAFCFGCGFIISMLPKEALRCLP
jgi:hypothetical protein